MHVGFWWTAGAVAGIFQDLGSRTKVLDGDALSKRHGQTAQGQQRSQNLLLPGSTFLEGQLFLEHEI